MAILFFACAKRKKTAPANVHPTYSALLPSLPSLTGQLRSGVYYAVSRIATLNILDDPFLDTSMTGELANDPPKAYEDGKHRRYDLLFKVNGGAFAIVSLVVKSSTSFKTDDQILGYLHLWHVSLGMAVLTTVLTADIFAFGIRAHYKDKHLFTWAGKLVLVLIGLLLTVAWVLVSFRGAEAFFYVAF